MNKKQILASTCVCVYNFFFFIWQSCQLFENLKCKYRKKWLLHHQLSHVYAPCVRIYNNKQLEKMIFKVI